MPRPVTRADQSFGQAIHDETETLLIPDKNTRGIWREPVAPGKYNLNPVAFTAYLVPTSAVTIDWAAGQDRGDTRISSIHVDDESKPSVKANEFFKFSQLRVTSQDGFQLDVDVRLVVRIIPEHAAYIIARFGSVENLIEQIVHPLIDSSFRNKAGEKKALDFIKGRTELQKEALERAKAEFEKYFVEAQNLLIAYIRADEALLKTQTEREIAVQQQMQYEEQAKAQEKNIVVKEKEARSDKQKDVINAKLSIDINSDNATASIRQAEGKKTTTILEAEGRKQAIILEAEGIQFKNQAEGEGLAKAYNAQREALGQDNILMIQIIEKMAAAGMKMVPDVYVGNSGESGINTALMNVAMLRAIPGMEKLLEIKTPKTPENK
jgi:regulator of protease activity HflC (stomatin/prohibitin superfamily)